MASPLPPPLWSPRNCAPKPPPPDKDFMKCAACKKSTRQARVCTLRMWQRMGEPLPQCWWAIHAEDEKRRAKQDQWRDEQARQNRLTREIKAGWRAERRAAKERKRAKKIAKLMADNAPDVGGSVAT